MSNTTASDETTENFMQAMNEYFARKESEKPRELITKLIYKSDGTIIGLTEQEPGPDDLWIRVDRKEFEKKYGMAYHWLRVKNGEVINTKPVPNSQTLSLEKGDTWHSDSTFRLIVDDNSGEQSNGWSKKSN